MRNLVSFLSQFSSLNNEIDIIVTSLVFHAVEKNEFGILLAQRNNI